ncbi:hypothetical protein NCS52_00997300 [Fusarium sp. LHS14.1]|nr:hypothetical protein NCS52_00997300 [Fusarium sp. LHS14.1]
MVVIKQDSELMTNYVSANPIPAGERFAVFRDANGEPGVFALSEDLYLYLVMVIDGKAEKIDFGNTSGIVSRGVKVQAFAVVQAPDSTLDICIATPGAGETSNFTLLHSITLSELKGSIPSSKVLCGSNFPSVHHIFMTNKSTDTKRTMPLAMVAFKRPDRIVDTEDLRFVQFGTSATLLGKWDLATNPKKILDVSLGTCALGDGAFVLYQGFTGASHIQFKFFTGSTMVVEPHCPAGATCISSYVDPNSHQSILLVGGQNVTAFKAKEYCSPKGAGTPIEMGDLVGSIKDLQVSQSRETLRFWYTTEADAVHYYTTKSTSLSNGKVTPILPEGQGGRISSMISLKSADKHAGSPALVSSLLSVDENGNLTLLQQDSASQLWQKYPFWHASTENVIELRGYMLRMHAVASNDNESSLIPGCWLRVSSSGVVRCIVNGRHASLSPVPQWHQTDAKGVLNIMLQNDDATCHQFAADVFRAAKPGSPETNLEIPILDPSRKMIKKLDGVKTADDVAQLRKPDGTRLVPNASHDDLKAAADSISTLVDQAHKFHEGSQQQFSSFRVEKLSSGVGGAVPYNAQFFSLGDLVDDLEGAWNWVEEKLKDAVKWGCDFIEDVGGRVWAFIIKIGDEVFNFALRTVSSIVKAITWVFKKLGTLLQDIIDFFGYLFGWNDILDTADSISAGFNVALDYGQELLDKSELKIDSWLEDLRKTIKAQLPGLQNNTYNGSQKALKEFEPATTSQSTDVSDEDEVKSGVAYNWSTYYFTYGGGTTNAYLHDDDSQTPDSPEKLILKLWDDVQSEVETIVKMGGNLAKDLLDFFISGKYNIQSLMGKISADLVDSMIDYLKILEDILFKALSLGISVARNVANKTIDIPVLGWLWKHVIAGGRSLSLLGLCSLLLAIPTTVLYKATKKVAPPKLKGRLTKDSFHEYVSGTAGDDLTKDIFNFGLASASSLELVYGEFETIALLADGAFEGTGLEAIPIGPVAALMSVVNSASLTFETVGGFLSWPVEGSYGTAMIQTNSFDVGRFAKYSKWGLTVTNFAANAVVKVVGKAKKAEQPAIKRWKGSVAAVISVPMLCLALTGDINDSIEAKKKTAIIVNHFIEAFLKFGKQWGFAVSSWNNEVENEIMYIALAVKQVCTYGRYGFKITDFIVEHV